MRPELERTPPDLAVSMEFDVPAEADHVSVQMPAWSPGDYHLQNHARYVQNLSAAAVDASGERRLQVTHLDTNTWSVDTTGVERVRITYTLPQTPPGFFSENVQLLSYQVFVNGPAGWLYLVDHKDTPTQMTVYAPPGWRVEMPLPIMTPGANSNGGGSASGTVCYSAPDYDTLADSPLVMGDPRILITREFVVDGINHRAVYFGHSGSVTDKDAYTPILKKIAQAENNLMGGPPYHRYEFLFDVDGRGGGLEHLNSARLSLWPENSPRAFAPFVAHEFFHLWNVKRIRPRVLRPFDYIHPPRTRNLWFVEGVTEYYAHIAVRRAGLATVPEFLNHWRSAIHSLQQNPAHLRVSADEASLRVWEAGNSEGYGLSYYDKGELIGLCLDLKIRHVTHGQKSLDDVMRYLMRRYAPPNPGYGEDDLRAAINEVTGQDLSDFYDLLARSTHEMPFTECLAYAGLNANLEPLPDPTPEALALRASWER